MPQFTHKQHKEVLREALGFLDQFGLDNPQPSGRTLRSEIELLFLDAINDDLSPGAIPLLLSRMASEAASQVAMIADRPSG